MKKERPVTAMKRRPAAPMIPPSAEPRLPINPESALEAAAGLVRFDPIPTQTDSAKFRAEILRRYDAPLALPWRHGGLNE
jgi:hypothetical protein